jgi:hypothetical protein
MLSHYESRLAEVLGARLAAPFAGRVFVSPGPSGGPDEPTLLVGTARAEVLTADFGASRPQVVPGADDPRRVLRLRCDVLIEVRASTAGGRGERVSALDAVLYELDAPDLRDASALAAQGDPGFVLSRQAPVSVLTDPGTEPAGVLISAEGWFWPPDTPGVTGVPISSAVVQAAVLPIALDPWPLNLRAGDAPVPLRVRMRTAAPVDSLAIRLRGNAAGQLTGGTPGPDGARIVPLTGDTAEFQYVPPAGATTDHLVIAVARPGPALGAELARFDVAVRP